MPSEDIGSHSSPEATLKQLTSAAVLWTMAALSAPAAAVAQTPATSVPMTCDQKAAAAKQAWATNSHSDLANVFHKEDFEIDDTWCRIWETTGRDRMNKAGDFARALFTGEGVHPLVSSSLVPGSGLAAGASFAVGQNLSGRHPIRFSEVADGRYAANASWTFGGRVEALGRGSRLDNRHINATVVVKHQHLAKLSHFGQGNDSVSGHKSVFGLNRTVSGGGMEIPMPGGLFASLVAAGLWLHPFSVHDGSLPSIADRLTAAQTPALGIAARYFVYGGGVRWKHPLNAVTHGYRVEAGGTLRAYHETRGVPLSFERLDLAWANHYTPDARIGTLSLAALASLSFVSSGNTVPFYLQPTVGGTDLAGTPVLRSFSDYRFRAPNRLAIVFEHEHDIIGPLGSLLFADWGQVAETRSAFSRAGFHHSFGAGVTVRLGDVSVFKMFYAWGGGEGTRTTFSTAHDSFAGTLGSRGIF